MNRSTIGFAVPRLRRHRRALAGLAVLLLAGTALALVPGLLIREYLDVIAGDASAARTAVLAVAGFLAVSLLTQVLAVAEGYAAERLSWSVTNELRTEVTAHCLRLDLSFHSDHLPGELVERIDGDTTVLSNFVSRFVVAVLSQALLLLGLLTALFVIDWRIGATLLPLGVAAFVVLRWLSARGRNAYEVFRQSVAAFTGFAGERLAGIADLAANGAVPHTMEATRRRLATIQRREQAEAMWGSIYLWSAASFFTWTGVAVSLLWSWQLYHTGAMTAGTAFLVFTYTQQMAGPLDNLTLQNQDYQAAAASVTRLRQLLDEPVRPPRPQRRPFPPRPPGIELRAVSFGYQPGTRVLHDVQAQVPAGHTLGVIGRTGSGKSTLARIVAGLYEPAGGAVLIDGTDLRDIDPAALRAGLAVVPQDVQLFSATLRDNLTLFAAAGEPRGTDDTRLHGVLDRLGLRDWLDRLPSGLDTVLGTGGHGLSGGEEQLVAFARVLLREPHVVILDEATSRLDPVTERLVQRATAALLDARTGIVIAHRLSTLDSVDRVLLLEQGRVVESGDRAALAADPRSHFTALLHAAGSSNAAVPT